MAMNVQERTLKLYDVGNQYYYYSIYWHWGLEKVIRTVTAKYLLYL